MKTITLEQAEADFRAVVKAGQKEPVVIMQNGQRLGYFYNPQQIENVEQNLDDRLWGEAAERALEKGKASSERVRNLLERYPDVET